MQTTAIQLINANARHSSDPSQQGFNRAACLGAHESRSMTSQSILLNGGMVFVW
jgi:hypothetical protein